MFGDENVGWWLVGLGGAMLLVMAAIRFYSTRLSRRRRKSHSPIISKARRPMVKFSVRLKERRKTSRKP